MEHHRQWLEEIIPLHARLTDVVVTLLQNVLNRRSIEFLSVTWRTKSIESTLTKIRRKQYRAPRDNLTDLSGIRVVTYLESEVQQVSDAIRETFVIDEKNSLDRSQVLGSDRIGYRSAHFVCSLGPIREKLLEYQQLTALKFEIQVRTVLQHAWAELAHDRSFKFSPGLPPAIQRRLNLYAGMLEIVDGGFDSISKEIDDYVRAINSKSIGEISSSEIDRVSIEKFLELLVADNGLNVEKVDIEPSVIKELKNFGVSKIDDLRSMVSKEYIRRLKSADRYTNYIGLLRDIMMFADIEKYFSSPVDWGVTTKEEMGVIIKKWGQQKVLRLLAANHIELLDDDDLAIDSDEM